MDLQARIEKRGTTMHRWIMYAILALNWIIEGSQFVENYRLSPAYNPSGLYFERMTTLRLQHADWRVVVFIETKKFIKDFSNDEYTFEEANSLCTRVNTQDSCDELLRTDAIRELFTRARALVTELEDISRDAHLTREPIEDIPRTIRKRAAPFAIIGTLSKSLFGTLDQDDAAYINSQIDRLFADQSNLTHLIGQRMHIALTRLQELHKEHVAEGKRVDMLEQGLRHLHAEVENRSWLSAKKRYNSTLINYGFRLERKIERYMDVCEHYIRVISAARNEKLDPSILTAAQLMSVAKDVQLRAAYFEFPISLDYLRAETLSIITRTDLVYHSGRVMIVLHIPLLDRTVYHLYRMHAWLVPQKINNNTGSAHVTPASPFIALSTDHRAYFLADALYVSACKLADHKHICAMEVPVHEVATVEECEIQMLTSPMNEVLQQCNVRLLPRHRPFWAHLPTQGGWLYSFDQPEKIHILCPNNPDEHVELNGAGTLYINPNCIGKTRSTTLTGIRTYKSREEFIYQPGILLKVTIVAPELEEVSETIIGSFLSSEKGTNTNPQLLRDWKIVENGESLHEIEEKIKVIGTHRRERQQTHGLFLACFAAQAAIILCPILYLCRGKILTGAVNLWRKIYRRRVPSTESGASPAIRASNVITPVDGVELPLLRSGDSRLNTEPRTLPPQGTEIA